MGGEEYTSLPKQSAAEAKNGTVYVQLDIKDDVLEPLNALHLSVTRVHDTLTTLATLEELRVHADQFAHARLVRALKWATGTILAGGGLTIAIIQVAGR